MLKRTNTIALDFDWFYRRGGYFINEGISRGFNSINRVANTIIAQGMTGRLADFFADGSARFCLLFVRPVWALSGISYKDQDVLAGKFIRKFTLANFSIGCTALCTLAYLLLFVIW